MFKVQTGKRQRDKLKNARATARSMAGGTEDHVREVVEQPAHDFRLKGSIGKGSLLETVFHVREAGYEVEKRIIDSRTPLIREQHSTAQGDFYSNLIPIPVRPKWEAGMSAQQVQELEDQEFEEYLERIYAAYPPHRLNHFEHNLHVWRQLWRVVELSDILILVADARHPLFHVPPSLYDFIVEQSKKPMLCILNKIDFISQRQLEGWMAFFAKRFPLLTVVPFSSFPQVGTVTNPDADVRQEKKRKAVQHERNAPGRKEQPPPYGVENLMRILEEVHSKKEERERKAAEAAILAEQQARAANPNWRPTRVKRKQAAFALKKQAADEAKNQIISHVDIMKGIQDLAQQGGKATPAANTTNTAAALAESAAQEGQTQEKVAEELYDGKTEAKEEVEEEDDEQDDEESEETDGTKQSASTSSSSPTSKLLIGMIGHPNVGKSSLINALFGRPMVTVSETPGKTKHLQSLALNNRMELVDCPGLVFPAVDMPRALQVLCGIFPISQLREPYSSVQYLASRVELEKIYSLQPPNQEDGGSKAGGAGPGKGKGKGKAKGKGRRGGDMDLDFDEEGADLLQQLALEEERREREAAYQWSAWDICEAYAKARNYSIKGSKGLFDTQRAANDILHDALSGVVLLTFSPPDSDQQKQDVADQKMLQQPKQLEQVQEQQE